MENRIPPAPLTVADLIRRAMADPLARVTGYLAGPPEPGTIPTPDARRRDGASLN